MDTRSSRFVILFTGRSGSSYLSSLLKSHPNVLCEGEMLAEIIRVGEPPEKQLGWSREFFEAKRAPQILCVGYKTKLCDVVDPDGFRCLLEEFGVRVVHLVRRNLVKQVISAINAERLHERTGQWNINDEGKRLGAFHVDPAKFDVNLRDRVSGEKQLATSVSALQLPTMRVSYEDLLSTREATLQKLCAFLEIPLKPVTSEIKKNTPDNLRDVVENFDELKAIYTGTDFEAMLDEA